MGGLPGIFGPPGLAANGGAGFGLAATGGGGLPANELAGLELAGEPPVLSLAVGAFFHGVAEPFDPPIPGKTATGFAPESANIDFARIGGFGVDEAVDAVGAGGAWRFAGGGGGGGGGGATAAAFGFRGTNSR